MGDRSKVEARKARAAREFEEAKRKYDPYANAVRCRSCKRSQPVMVEMGGFVFCSECTRRGISALTLATVSRATGKRAPERAPGSNTRPGHLRASGEMLICNSKRVSSSRVSLSPTLVVFCHN